MFSLDTIKSELFYKQKVDQILKCNTITKKYGLVLKEKEVKELLDTQYNILREVGRLELGGTIIEQIIETFCDSQFFTKYEYASNINQLLETFYYYKEATDELLNDEDIIKYMYQSFDGPCQGSYDWLNDNQLYRLLNKLSEGKDIFEDLKYGTY